MGKLHRYRITVEWTGNTGTGTANYRSYERRYKISAGSEKPPIPGSSDPAFRGDPARWNPEELLVASLCACHQLWFLHLCSSAGIVVESYVDHAEGVMEETPDGAGQFREVILRPQVKFAPGADPQRIRELHEAAHEKCFIARSVNFTVKHEPETIQS